MLVDGMESEAAKFKTQVGGTTGRGFLINDAELEGSVLCFPRSAFLWRPRTMEEVTVESLSAVALAEPTFEILLIGTGAKTRRPSNELVAHFRNLGIVVEMTNTVGTAPAAVPCLSAALLPELTPALAPSLPRG